MAKNALLRYRFIDKCLQNRGRKWTWQDILKRVNEDLHRYDPTSQSVGKTTFFKDIRDIESLYDGAEINRICEGRTVYYSYSDPNYSIYNQTLTEMEIDQLRAAITVLCRFQGIPQFDWINEIVPMLESKLGLISTSTEIISFESSMDYLGSKHIQPLFNAINNKRVLRILYKDFKHPDVYEIELHPHYLKQYNSRWFLMSFTERWGDKPQIHALDRIQEIVEVQTSYRVMNNFDWDDYFSDMIGVSKIGDELVNVKLLILDQEQADYISTKPLHRSQKRIRKSEVGFETSITVIPNPELEKLILSFGERVKVLQPDSLFENIKRRLTKASNLY